MFCSAPRKWNLFIFATASSHCLLVLSPCWVEIHLHLWKYTSKINKICHDYPTDRGFWKWSSRNILIVYIGQNHPKANLIWGYPRDLGNHPSELPMKPDLGATAAGCALGQSNRRSATTCQVGDSGIWGMDYHQTHRIHGAGIYASIWGILMVNVTIYIAYMDPMGNHILLDHFCHSNIGVVFETAPMLMT